MQTNMHSQAEAALEVPERSAAGGWKAARILEGFGRHMKPVIAGGVLLAAALAILTEAGSVTSNSAVISAQVVTVRTPIEGEFAGSGVKADDVLDRGALLGSVTDSRVNELAESMYQSQRSVARGQVAAIEAERAQLIEQRTSLQQRAASYTAASTARMDREVAEAERMAAAHQAALVLARADLVRGQQLYGDGILSRAAYDKVISDAQVARDQAAAQDADLAATRVEEAATRNGLMIEAGSNNDVTYSLQRIDEINLRLADLSRERAVAAADADAAEANYAPVVAHDRALSSAPLKAPAGGRLWKWYAMDGERIGAGERVAEIVDCRASFLLASFPQDRVPAIGVGAPARYRLSGEQAEHVAHVASIEAALPVADGLRLAAQPVQESDRPAVLVRLTTEPGDRAQGCSVGRTASVVIDAPAGNAVATLFHRYF